jgi:hypothetical protein
MPELDDGTDVDGLRPLEPEVLDVLEPELDAAELPELVDAAEFDAADLCACPGRVRETTPAAASPANPVAAGIGPEPGFGPDPWPLSPGRSNAAVRCS